MRVLSHQHFTDAAPPLHPRWKEICGGCGKDSSTESPQRQFQQCSRCQKRRYCSVECQRQDWSAHKADCKEHLCFTFTAALHLHKRSPLHTTHAIYYLFYKNPSPPSNDPRHEFLLHEAAIATYEDCFERLRGPPSTNPLKPFALMLSGDGSEDLADAHSYESLFRPGAFPVPVPADYMRFRTIFVFLNYDPTTRAESSKKKWAPCYSIFRSRASGVPVPQTFVPNWSGRLKAVLRMSSPKDDDESCRRFSTPAPGEKLEEA
ncbi:hypothetical protein RQP46_003110 [Phenoliferia psychrophenolica]